jgi:hypothetical protein
MTKMQDEMLENKMTETLHEGKMKMRSRRAKEYVDIPSFVFRDRTLAVLEVMVEYLRDVKKMKFHEIAQIINRDDRTVWTVYRRAKIKRRGIIKSINKEDEHSQ